MSRTQSHVPGTANPPPRSAIKVWGSTSARWSVLVEQGTTDEELAALIARATAAWVQVGENLAALREADKP